MNDRYGIFGFKTEFERASKNDNSKSVLDSLNWQRRLVERRANGERFTIQDHVKGMVYSLLSSRRRWSAVAELIEREKPRDPFASVFENYDPDILQRADFGKIEQRLRAKRCPIKKPGRSNLSGAEAVINNIKAIQDNYEAVERVATMKSGKARYDKARDLVDKLGRGGGHPFFWMREALVAQYFRNVGIDIPKPDTHLCRFFGEAPAKGMTKNAREATCAEVFNEVWRIHEETGLNPMEIDQYIWFHCSKSGLRTPS